MKNSEKKYIKISIEIIKNQFYVMPNPILKFNFLPDDVKISNLSEKKLNFEKYYYNIVNDKSIMECYIEVEKYPKVLITIITFDEKEKLNFICSDNTYDFDLTKLNYKIKEKIIEIKSIEIESLNVSSLMLDDIFF